MRGICWRATGETFGVKHVQCARQRHAASGQGQQLGTGDRTVVFSCSVIVPCAPEVPVVML